MRRFLSTAVTLGLLALLSGCGMPGSGAPESSRPATATPEAAATPAPSPTTAAPAPSAPTCEAIFTAAQVTTLMGEGMQGIGDQSSPAGYGYGTTVLELQQLLAAVPDTISCTWVLPATERGVTLSIASVDATARTAAEAYFDDVATFTEGTATYYQLQGLEVDPYTEAHVFDGDLWIASYDGAGTNALGVVQAALAAVRG